METQEECREVQVIESNDFMPVLSPKQAVQRYEMIRECVKSTLRENLDFGKIPGTGDKPTLLKPGAEKLCTIFGLCSRFIVEEKDEDWTGQHHNGEMFFRYKYRCQLFRGAMMITEGIGQCSSWETKYRYRTSERTCPNCGKPTVFRSKADKGGGWYCWAKKGGCGMQWKSGERSIEDQIVGKVPNPDVADQVNTFDKMAQKRAFVAATLIAVNASDYFTQDMEDFAPEHPVSAEAEVVQPTAAAIQQPRRKEAAPQPEAQALVDYNAFLASLKDIGANMQEAKSTCAALFNHEHLANLTRAEAGEIFHEIKRSMAADKPQPAPPTEEELREIDRCEAQG